MNTIKVNISPTSLSQYLPLPQSSLAHPQGLWRSVLPAGNGRCLQERQCFHYVTKHQTSSFHQGEQSVFVQSFPLLPGALMASLLRCSVTEKKSIWRE